MPIYREWACNGRFNGGLACPRIRSQHRREFLRGRRERHGRALQQTDLLFRRPLGDPDAREPLGKRPARGDRRRLQRETIRLADPMQRFEEPLHRRYNARRRQAVIGEERREPARSEGVRDIGERVASQSQCVSARSERAPAFGWSRRQTTTGSDG